MSDSKMMSGIDTALAAAKARKAMKESAGILVGTAQVKSPRAIDPAKEIERAAAKAIKFVEREERRAAREALKEARGDKPTKGPAHMKKVQRALSKLPSLNETAAEEFKSLVANFGVYELEKFALHLQHYSRTQKTIQAAQGERLPLGASVTIIGGEPRFIGLQGKVIHAQKLRAKVAVDGLKKPVYIYTGEAKINQ